MKTHLSILTSRASLLTAALLTMGTTARSADRPVTLKDAYKDHFHAKKIVEVDLRQKGTELHDATVVGDTVGDPFKDTSSVAMNPITKFTTLFGLLATEIAIKMDQGLNLGIGIVLFLVALVFVYRSFFGMRIPEESAARN